MKKISTIVFALVSILSFGQGITTKCPVCPPKQGAAADSSCLRIINGVVVWLPCAGSTNNFWGLTGNAGTTAGTNFIGTTDSKKLYFKTKNTTAIVVDTNQNVGIGTTTPFGKFTVNDNNNNLIFGAQYSDLVTDTVWGTTMIDSCHKYGIIVQDPSAPNDHYTVLYSMDSCTGEGAQLFLNHDAFNQEMGIILNYDNPDTNKASRLTFNSDGLRILKNTDFSYLFQITAAGQMVYTKGAANGYVLTSDANGNASWQQHISKVDLTNQTASITTTNISGTDSAGFYLLDFYLVNSVADGTAGNVTITITWNDGVAARTITSSALALTSNGFINHVTGATTENAIYKNGSSPIQFSTTATTVNSAAYDLHIRVEDGN